MTGSNTADDPRNDLIRAALETKEGITAFAGMWADDVAHDRLFVFDGTITVWDWDAMWSSMTPRAKERIWPELQQRLGLPASARKK